MAQPNLSDLLFAGGAKIKGLPAAAAAGEALTLQQLALAYRSGTDVRFVSS